MPYQQEAARLLALLHQRWGEEPAWVLRPNREYGFYLLYRQRLVPIGEVRELIESTFGFATGPSFIIDDLEQGSSLM